MKTMTMSGKRHPKTTRKVYVYRSAPVGYGPRIFVPYEHVTALDAVLKPLTTWGGYDTDTGKARGYEFPSSTPERFLRGIAEARARGFKVVDATAENAREFWV